MSIVVFLSAFLMGLAGSFHCMGMCGPIALSIPVPAQHTMGRGWSVFLYFFGKTVTYGCLGIIFGFLGHQLVMVGLQQTISIVSGIVMLIFVVVTVFKPILFHKNSLTEAVSKYLLPLFGVLLKKPGKFSSFYLGMLNGMLPCGLVYMGLTAAIATGSVVNASLFMVVFGVGTMPAMLAFVLLTRQLSNEFRSKVRNITPILMTIVAVVLILRGLNLGIPFVSPLVDALSITGLKNTEVIGCH